MRLDKFLSNNTAYSRREIHQFIHRGEVCINGTAVRKSDLKISGDEQITLQNELITHQSARYFMLHKPIGYVCANHDSEHPTVLDLLSGINTQQLQIVGRLDIDTTGLVLLTDDGDWNHRVTAPRRHCTKTYLVECADPISGDAQARFLAGVLLHGESTPTLPAQLELLGTHTARLQIQEGKYHQVKRMFAALGNRVVSLHREAIGEIVLEPNLLQGQYRPLSRSEIDTI
jgi:16S rRNA pseudouridine516 synthase